MRFLTRPNLPDGKVKLCAIASGNPAIKAALESMDVAVIELTPHNLLAKPVAAHADMQLHDMGGGRVAVAKGEYRLAQELNAHGFDVCEQKLSREYPGDIALNCFVLGEYLFCKTESTSDVLLNHYQSIGVEAVNINQGYAKCSTCIVDCGSVITSDTSIAKAVKACGMDVLQIKSGSIILPGYDSGFIGGCCGLIAPYILAFTGKASLHPDYERIKAFCVKRGVAPVELTNLPLTDIGGILPLAIY